MASLGTLTRVTVPHPWLLAPWGAPHATRPDLT
jgi:hypothetical protein